LDEVVLAGKRGILASTYVSLIKNTMKDSLIDQYGDANISIFSNETQLVFHDRRVANILRCCVGG
jgi:hypothetical protein